MQRSITGYQNIERPASATSSSSPFFQTCPSHVGGSERLVLKKMFAQAVREIFVEQHFHGVN